MEHGIGYFHHIICITDWKKAIRVDVQTYLCGLRNDSSESPIIGHGSFPGTLELVVVVENCSCIPIPWTLRAPPKHTDTDPAPIIWDELLEIPPNDIGSEDNGDVDNGSGKGLTSYCCDWFDIMFRFSAIDQKCKLSIYYSWFFCILNDLHFYRKSNYIVPFHSHSEILE